MIALDVKTVLLGYVLSNVICVAVIAMLWRDNRDRYAGLGFWLSDRVLQLLAVLAVLLRGVVPEPVSIMLGTPLGVGGTILLYIGLERYAGKPVRQWPNLVLFVALVAGQAWFTFAQPNLAARNIILSIALVAVSTQCAWLLLRLADRDIRRDARVVGVIFCAYALINAARIISEIAAPSPDDIFDPGFHGALALMTYQMVAIGLTFSLFLMVNRREARAIENHIAERREAEVALRKQDDLLRQSEVAVRTKLKAVTQPDGDIGALELSDIMDVGALQSLMEDFHRLTGMLGAVLDISGKVLVAVGWQDVCTKFHRCHPETSRNCIESDTILTRGVPPGTFKAYRCKNNMWDMVTPLMIGQRHVGNVFIGQFFYEGETPDAESFRKLARQYGFDEAEYLAALERVPRFTREKIDAGMRFYANLAQIISTLSFSAIRQSRLLAEREQSQKALQASEERYRQLFEHSPDGIAILDGKLNFIDANERFCQMLGYTRDELMGLHASKAVVLGEANRVENELAEVVKAPPDNLSERKFLRKDGSSFIGEAIASTMPDGRHLGIVRDITERKQAEKDLKRQFTELKRLHDVMLGRERRVIELKREINGLLLSSGQAARYPSAATHEDGLATGEMRAAPGFSAKSAGNTA